VYQWDEQRDSSHATLTFYSYEIMIHSFRVKEHAFAFIYSSRSAFMVQRCSLRPLIEGYDIAPASEDG
jgi:hypothetical protein